MAGPHNRQLASPGPGLTRRAFVAGAALLPVAVAGCGNDQGGGSAGAIRMAWWGNEERAAITQQALDLFQQKNPGITVEREYTGSFDDYWDRIATQTAGGNSPDVIQMSTSYIVEYGDRGALLDLAPHLDQTIPTADLAKGSLDPYRTDAGVFGIPWVGNVWTLLFNEKVLADAGIEPPGDDLQTWTWESFEAMAQRISDATPDDVYGILDFGGQSTTFEAWVRQRGKEIFTDDGKLGFEPADLAAFWTITDRMRRSGASTPPEITSAAGDTLEQNPMAHNKTGLLFYWSNQIVGLTEVGGGPEQTPLHLIRVPGEAPTPSQNVHASQLLSAGSKTEDPEACAKLIDFLLNDPEAGKILGSNRGTPLNEKVAESIKGTVEPVETKEIDFIAAQSTSFAPAPAPFPVGGGEITDGIFLRIYEELMYGRTSVDQAAASFFEQAEQVLARGGN
jgi:multiple sugar transport system substrate-binding protein